MKKLVLFFFICWQSVSFAHPISPKDKQLHFNNSIAFENKGMYNDAIKELIFIYDENSYEINLRLGWLHYLNGLFTESTTYYQNAIQLMPFSIEARLGYVLPSSAIGNWNKVIQQYEEILNIDPNNQVAGYRYASILYGRSELAQAERLMGKLVNLYPFNYDYLVLYGWINLKLGKAENAKVLFQKVLLLNPADSSALKGLALLN